MLGVNPRDVSVPVVGGHAGVTILPLLSQVLIMCFADVIIWAVLIPH